MSGIYVGEEDCIEMEDGTRVYILRDLSQGADDDLWAFEMAQGSPSIPGQRTFWTTKLLELAIVKMVEPDGEEYKPTLEQVRSMKAGFTDRLREEVMSRWFPLAWAELKALLEAGPEEEMKEERGTETTSGGPSTGSRDSANRPPRGSSESTSSERCTGTSGPTGRSRSGLLKMLRGLWPRRR